MATPLSSYPPQTTSGTTTSWLPITSAWPSISECSSVYWIPDAPAVAFDPSIGASNTLLTCLPPAATLWWEQATPTPVLTVTSLGPLVCPSGYYIANQSTIDPTSTFTACCPSNYRFEENILPAGTYGECKSSFSTGHTFVFYTADETNGPWTLSTSIWANTVAGVVTAPPLNGYNLALSTSSSSSASSTPSTSASTSPSPSSSTGLSTGAKAGISVAVALSVLASFAIGVLYFVRRRRQSSSQAVAGTASGGSHTNPGELHSAHVLEKESKPRLVPTEMDAGFLPPEMNAHLDPQELDTGGNNDAERGT